MRLGLGNNLVKTAFPIGTSPSLDLAFALDRSFTTDPAAAGGALITSRRGPAAKFSRGSGATQVNAAGLIEYAPENLLTYSEDMTSANGWTIEANLTAWENNATTSPSGLVTAEKLTEPSTTSGRHITSKLVPTVIGTSYTLSVYAKASERSILQIASSVGFTTATQNFDLTNNALGTGDATEPSIVSVGSGWYRCSIRVDSSATGNSLFAFGIVPSATSGRFTGYAGVVGNGLFLWGAQVERASTARTYYPTTTAAFYGPRFDHDPATGASKGLLIEESRTNLLLRSNEFSTATWGKATTSVAEVAGAGLDGGSAWRLTPSSANSDIGQSITVAAATTYTFSVWLKSDTGSNITLQLNIYDNISTTQRGTKTITVTPQWQRFDIAASSVGANSTRYIIGAFDSWSTGENILAWGAQVEAGASPTSYIPTTTGTAARSADVCSIIGTDFTSFYNQSEGTLLTDSIPQTVNGTSTVFGVSNGTANERFWNRFAPSEQAVVTSGGVESQLDATNPVAGTRYKIAVAVKLNDLALSLDGAAVVTDISQSMPTVDRAGIGNPLGVAAGGAMHIARIQYFRKRLSNDKLQALTAL